MKKLTVGIPAYKAQDHISDCLSSIQVQTIKDEISVIIASDNPEDDYEFTKERYPDLDITILDCDENTGAGLARQRALDACETDWITFIDADDVFFTPFALEQLYKGTNNPVIIEVQGAFLQEIENKLDSTNNNMQMFNNMGMRGVPRNDVGHPWVFGRLYNRKFLKDNDIEFSELRAMEDGEFNWKIRMTIEGSPFQIAIIEEPVYLWRVGSEHSITRSNQDENGIPQYNFDLCQTGATIASIRASKFCRKKNPFNGGIDRFIAEMMVDKYFTYVECCDKKPIFADQNLFNAKRFYHECFEEIEGKIEKKILSDIYTMQRAQHGGDLLGIIPEISFFEFMEKIKTDEYGGEEELKEIRSHYPAEIIESDIKTGVAIF